MGQVEGRWVPVQITIGADPSATEPDDAPVIITAELIRSVPVGLLIEKVHQYRAAHLREELERPDVQQAQREIRQSLERRLAQAEREARQGGRGLGPSHYAEVAEIYLEASGSPTTEVAKRKNVSVSTAATWVSRARDMGLLDPTTKGRAGGISQAKKSKRTKKGRSR